MKKFLVKLTIFILLIVGIQTFVPPSKDIPNEIKLLDFFMKNHADIIYFGDSTINWAAQTDRSQNSMPDLLQQLLPESRIAKITHASYQMDVYYAFARYMVRKGYRPKVVIIPINLRSFSTEWDQQPLWQFEKEKLTLAMKDTFWMKFYKPLAVFKFFEPRISRLQYEQTEVFDGVRLIGRVSDFDNESYQNYSEQNMRNKLLFRYAYTLSAEHRKIQSLVQTATLLRESGIQTVFYVTPVDVRTIAKYLGPDYVNRIFENTALIKKVLADHGVGLLDLAGSLETEDFSWMEDGIGPYYPNEHLKLRGRMIVVKNIFERTELKRFEP